MLSLIRGQAGEDRVIIKYKPKGKNHTITSHWESVEDMLKEAGEVDWYKILVNPYAK